MVIVLPSLATGRTAAATTAALLAGLAASGLAMRVWTAASASSSVTLGSILAAPPPLYSSAWPPLPVIGSPLKNVRSASANTSLAVLRAHSCPASSALAVCQSQASGMPLQRIAPNYLTP